ncbi:hypothetical protein Tco_1084990, partial [Tanacetum coccineum]
MLIFLTLLARCMESVGSHAPRVILFGAVPAIIPVIPEVPIVLADPIVAPEEGTISVISPTRVLDLVNYSSSYDSDLSEDSLPPIPDSPLVSPSGSSSHDTLTPSSEYPLAHVIAPPGIRRRRAILIRPREDIPIGRLYRTHPGGPCRALNAGSRRFAPLSTPYPPTTSESSLGLYFERSLDSSLLSSGPSRKRCRSLTTSVPSPTHDSRSIAPTPADLLPPRKR